MLLCVGSHFEALRASDITLGWTPSPDADVVGYKVYYGALSGFYTNFVDSGSACTATISNLIPGVVYVFAATAVDGTGKESEFSNEVTFQVPKDPCVIRLSNLEQTYDGIAKSVTATTVPLGLQVSISYNGTSEAPTNAGRYEVVAMVEDATYAGELTNSLVISPARAEVVLEGLQQVYDGLAKKVSVRTQPSGLAVTLSYDGQSSAPVQTGTYSVTAVVSDPNYQGSAYGTLRVVESEPEVEPATLVLNWPIITNDVTLQESRDLVTWESITNLDGRSGPLTIPCQPGIHLFRMVSQSPDGLTEIPIILKRR